MTARIGVQRAALGLLLALAALVSGCGSRATDKAGGRGSAGTTQTLKLHTGPGPGGYFPIETKHKPPGAPWAGFTKTSAVYDGSTRTGSQDTICMGGGLGGRADCAVTLTLKRGTISAQGVFLAGAGTGGTLAVTGGTGAYEGARGTYKASVPGPDPQLIIVHLLLP